MITFAPVPPSSDQTAQWARLFRQQLAAVNGLAYGPFAGALKTLGICGDHYPDFDALNKVLIAVSGWKVYTLPFQLPTRQFFRLAALKRFGVNSRLRPHSNAPATGLRTNPAAFYEFDLFQHVFGALPLLVDPRIAGYLHRLALIADRFASQPDVSQEFSRLFRHTLEYGLVRENNEIKIFGSALLSWPEETRYSLSPGANLLPFDLSDVLATEPGAGLLQEQYFVLDSIDQLADIIDDLDQLLRDRFG
jgi:phenylalanine-4-hydroxylase